MKDLLEPSQIDSNRSNSGAQVDFSSQKVFLVTNQVTVDHRLLPHSIGDTGQREPGTFITPLVMGSFNFAFIDSPRMRSK
jgi:hypothetical protein